MKKTCFVDLSQGGDEVPTKILPVATYEVSRCVVNMKITQ